MKTLQEVPVINNSKAHLNADGLHRQWLILSKLSATRWLGTRHLVSQLQREGIDISIRTIQRDLNQLSKRFPIESNRQVPQGWRWQQGAEVLSMPMMTSSQAVTFMMAEEHLRHLLPPSLLNDMRPWFDLAKRSMVQDGSTIKDWVNRVRILPPTQSLIPPPVNIDAQQNIYEALLLEKQLQVTYQKRGLEEAKIYRINPLALVQRGPIIYVLCTYVTKNIAVDAIETETSDIRQFALHRFVKATILENTLVKPVNFNLDEYLNSGALDFKSVNNITDEAIQIKLVFDALSGHSLLECKLSNDQVVDVDNETQRINVTATVPMTQQLVWWLRGFGKGLLSIAPETLRIAVQE